MTEPDYVSIVRHFRDREASPTTAIGRQMLRGVRDPLTWTDLLPAEPSEPSKHIVLVAPSRLGKSTELQQQARSLRNEGRHAVFVSVRELVAWRSWEDALETDESIALEQWLATGERAVLFVDGVDELVLVGREFNALVRRLARLLGDGRKRCQLVLSARGGWSREHAVAIGAGLLEEEPDCLREMTFEALDQEAVRQLAATAGCQRVDGFMDAYRRREIETARPPISARRERRSSSPTSARRARRRPRTSHSP